MALEKFALDSLSRIDDGRLAAAFRHALKRCEDDCRDRPAVKDPRRITLHVTLEPVVEDGDDLSSVDVSFKIVDSVPKRQTRKYNMRAVPGGLLFNEASPDEVRQMTLDMAPRPEPVDDEDGAGEPTEARDAQ